MERDLNFYKKEIAQAKKRFETYFSTAKDVEEDYTSAEKNHNVLFSNTETLRSALLIQLPKPVLRLRWPKEREADPYKKAVYTAVGEVCERAISTQAELSRAKAAFDRVKTDYALVGRGVAWVAYEPVVTVRENAEGQAEEYVSEQNIRVDYVRWDDFLHSDGKKWPAVWWVARRHRMSPGELKERFGETAELDEPAPQKGAPQRAEVWELWDKEARQVVFFAENGAVFLEKKPDPYRLPDFFPCPEPAFSVRTNKDLIPVPDFCLYKKIAKSLNDVCRRMDGLVRNMRSRMFYPARYAEQIRRVAESEETTYTPLDMTPEMMDKGGLSAVLFFEPLAEKQQVVAGLQAQKEQLRNDIYEITGIADIMRASSNPAETATAQTIKSRFGSLRLQARQDEINRLVRDAYELIAQLICEHFDENTLGDMTGVELPQTAPLTQEGQPAGPSWLDVLEIMKDDRLRSYTLEVESTASVFESDEAGKARRVEVFEVFNKMTGTLLPLIAQAPEMMDAAKEMVSFVLEPYRASRGVKTALENAFLQIRARAARAAQTPSEPSPEAVLAQAEMVKAQAQTAKAQSDAQISAAKLQLQRAELAQQQQKDAADLHLEREKMLADLQLEVAKLRVENEALAARLAVQTKKQSVFMPRSRGNNF